MLAAVLNGKRRGTGFAGKQLMPEGAEGAEGAEDVLTATVFERLAYLPESVLAAFFANLLAPVALPGTLEDMQFWPSWSLHGQRVEPDVVCYGSERSVLVEAKRYDDSTQQYAAQLARELQAGRQALGDCPLLLTIGGLTGYTAAATDALARQIDAEPGMAGLDYELLCRRWHDVYLALQAALATATDDARPGLRRLLDDVAATYEWHGLRTHGRRWLAQLAPAMLATSAFAVRWPVAPAPSAPVAVSPLPALALLDAPGIGRVSFPRFRSVV